MKEKEERERGREREREKERERKRKRRKGERKRVQLLYRRLQTKVMAEIVVAKVIRTFLVFDFFLVTTTFAYFFRKKQQF